MSALTEVSFGEWLKRRRKALDLSQEALADRVGCSAAMIRKIEAEERQPSAQIVERLADIFEIPSNERTAFLRFARGDWRATPTGAVENAPWRVSGSPQPEMASAAAETQNSKAHLATFLFTDIENSTKLWERAPEQMKLALQRHHKILQEVIVSNGGEVFQIVGDAFYAAFLTVPAAIAAAVTAQRQLHEEPWDLPFPLRVRMGIHTGEAKRAPNGSLIGGYQSNQTLNRVARILSAGHGGQILLSLATKELVKDTLPPATELRDLGEHHLRDLNSPDHLFQLNIAGLPSNFSPLNTLTYRHNLPVQVTSFIAREAEIALVHEYLSKADTHLVTLIGPPGIGKTRLSIEVARAALSEFPDGVFFVPLAPLDNADLIVPTVVQILGFPETGGKAPLERLKEGIADKQMLLILDNCEHLIERVASLVHELLSACSRLKILTSSREALRVSGEWLCPLTTLNVPEVNSLVDIKHASTFPALMLFAERARAVRPDFKLNAGNLQTVATICSELDGLPLAIELVAARVRLLSPEALMSRLSDQFTPSTDRMRAREPRQQTLNNAIGWSFDLLSAEEQKCFAYLSVFSGGFTLEAAEAIFSRARTNASVADLVISLLDKSLVQRISDEQSETRFYILKVIQQFAIDRLRQMGAESEARNWHLAYFFDLAERAEPFLTSAQRQTWLELLKREHDNLRIALAWSQGTEQGLRLIGALRWFWEYAGRVREGRTWAEQAIQASTPSETATWAKVFWCVGCMAWLQGDNRTARSWLEESARIWRILIEQAGSENQARASKRGLARTLRELGNVVYNEKDFQAARLIKQSSSNLFREVGTPWDLALDLHIFGRVLMEQHEMEAAHATFNESAALFRQENDAWGMGITFIDLGIMALQEGNLADAAMQFKEGLTAILQSPSAWSIPNVLSLLAAVATHKGESVRAAQLFGTAEMLREQAGFSQHVIYQTFIENGINATRKQLSEKEFATQWAKGRAMPVEQAIAYALEYSDE